MIQEMDLMEIFYWFHRHPELSYEEYDTTAQIKKLLKAADVKILPIPMETGLIAEVKGEKDGPVQALRCDIDALPITELTDLPYASECPGKMHACGHDFHITAGIGTAIWLRALWDSAVFLPARRRVLPGRMESVGNDGTRFGYARLGLSF